MRISSRIAFRNLSRRLERCKANCCSDRSEWPRDQQIRRPLDPRKTIGWNGEIGTSFGNYDSCNV